MVSSRSLQLDQVNHHQPLLSRGLQIRAVTHCDVIARRLPGPPRLEPNLKFKLGGSSQATKSLSPATGVMGVSSMINNVKMFVRLPHVFLVLTTRIQVRTIQCPEMHYNGIANSQKKKKQKEARGRKSRNNLWVIHWTTLRGIVCTWKGPKKSQGRINPIHRTEIVRYGWRVGSRENRGVLLRSPIPKRPPTFAVPPAVKKTELRAKKPTRTV